MQRRLKIGMVSITKIIQYGADMQTVLPTNLPEGTKILNQWDDHERGCVSYILYHDDFNEMGEGTKLDRINIHIPDKPSETSIIYDH